MSLEELMKKYSMYVIPASHVREHPRMSLGPLSVNAVVGHPDGVPMGSIIQIVGSASHGKTTLALDIVASFQRRYREHGVLYVDLERTFRPAYASACGVDVDSLLLMKPDYAEQAITLIEEFITRGGVKLVVLDSVPFALPKEELDKGFEERQRVASSAQLITRFCTRIVQKLDNQSATIVLINQFRKNFSLSREQEIPFGGLALQYASSLVLYIKRIEHVPDGFLAEVTVKKSKVGNPRGRSVFPIRYGRGIDHTEDVLNLAIDLGIVTKRGSWYTYATYKAQGLDTAKETFPADSIRQDVIRVLSTNNPVGTIANTDAYITEV